MADSDDLKVGIEILNQAVIEDNNRNYQVAIHKYEFGIEFLLSALKDGKYSDDVKKAISQKCSAYLDRLEKLQSWQKEANAETMDSLDLPDVPGPEANGKLEDLLFDHTDLTWSDVAGLEEAKEAIKQIVFMQIKFPHLFKNKVPFRNVLIVGAPGTGKTMLGRAIVNEFNSAHFHGLNCFNLVYSKVKTNQRRLLQDLFELVRRNQPSILFLDDIDALCFDQNDVLESDLADLLKEIENDQVYVVAATNRPWKIHSALDKSFHRKALTVLPDQMAREQLLIQNLKSTTNSLSREEIAELAHLTEKYSGADLSVLVRDASMAPVREIQKATHFKKTTGPSPQEPNVTSYDLYKPCSASDPDAIKLTFEEIDQNHLMVRPITLSDLKDSLSRSSPSLDNQLLWRLSFWVQNSTLKQ